MALFFKSDDVDVAALVRAVNELAAQLGSYELQANALERDLSETKEQLGQAALAAETGKGDRKAVDTLAKKVGAVEAERTIKLYAANECRKQLAAKRQELHKAGTANRERDAKRLANQRAKAFEEIIAGLEQVNRGWQKAFAVNTKLVGWSPTLATNHAGCLVSANEVTLAVATEIARISSPLPLSAGTPALPGARVSLLENPAAHPTLASVIEAANAELVRRIVDGAVSEPSEADPDDAILNPTATAQAPAQTFNAAQLMPAHQTLTIK